MTSHVTIILTTCSSGDYDMQIQINTVIINLSILILALIVDHHIVREHYIDHDMII